MELTALKHRHVIQVAVHGLKNTVKNGSLL